VYQNVDGKPNLDPDLIKMKLMAQLTSPVMWTQTMQNMITDGVTQFFEVGGNGTVLSGFLKRIDRSISVQAL
jgi:[acyl-carrier-protein] S-malonyltransferase